MKKFKHEETGHIIEASNPNCFSIYPRFGYVELIEKVEEEVVVTVDEVEEVKEEVQEELIVEEVQEELIVEEVQESKKDKSKKDKKKSE